MKTASRPRPSPESASENVPPRVALVKPGEAPVGDVVTAKLAGSKPVIVEAEVRILQDPASDQSKFCASPFVPVADSDQRLTWNGLADDSPENDTASVEIRPQPVPAVPVASSICQS